MNADVARLLARVCGIRPQLVGPNNNINTTSTTTQVSLLSQSQGCHPVAPSSSGIATSASARAAPTLVPIPQVSHVLKEVNSGVDFTIRVINPKYKREAKTYVLHLVPMMHITTLKRFKEIILEQLGKNVVCFSLEFDVGYIVSSSKICFN